ncbi:hypothetical protein [Actinomadura flavalba]|uniref:hypothetical protein n=1 Tax=Actinomadura flavalba TaxID=1120938 RepID=UPI0003A6BE4D|nr:hypothetical protein [Actinomadura flavalba]
MRGEVLRWLLLAGTADEGEVAALRVRGACVTGVLDLRYSEVPCPIVLADCHFTETPALYGARMRQLNLSRSHLPALEAATLHVDGVLRLTGCHIAGETKLGGARIAGALFADDAVLDGPVQLHHATVQDDLWAIGLHAPGGLRLSGATIGGQANLIRAHLGSPAEPPHNSTPPAETPPDQTPHDGAHPGETPPSETPSGETPPGETPPGETPPGETAAGERAPGRTPHDGTPPGETPPGETPTGETPPGETPSGATPPDRTPHDGTPPSETPPGETPPGQTPPGEAPPGETAPGETAPGETAPGRGPRGAGSGDGMALDAESLSVGSNVLADDLRAFGQIELRGARIPGRLVLTGARLSHPGRTALRASSCTIGELWMRHAHPVEGLVSVRRSRIDVLELRADTWADGVRLAGLTYTALNPPLPPSERLAMLDRDMDGHVPHSYEQLAADYRNRGDESAARTVQLARLRRHRRTLPWYARTWGLLQDVTVGYGYRPRRAAAWLVALLTAGTLAYGLHHPEPLKADEHPAFNPLFYTLDLLLPIIDFGQERSFKPAGAHQWLAYALVLLGWILATTIIAGTSRALSRQ